MPNTGMYKTYMIKPSFQGIMFKAGQFFGPEFQ